MTDALTPELRVALVERLTALADDELILSHRNAEWVGHAPILEEDIALALGDLHDTTAMVVVKRGPNAGSKFVLDNDVTRAGRHPDSDIFLDDITVSRRHAEIHRSGDGFMVRDAGSLNGTYLNRERIEEAPLSNGDELQIGKFKLVFLAGPSGGG